MSFQSVEYQGIVNVRGRTGSMPVVLLQGKDHTIAVPLEPLEARLIQHVLEEPEKPPQPHRALMQALQDTLTALKIYYSDALDMPTRLVLGPDTEIEIACSDGIACALVAGVPILVCERLLSEIGASASSHFR